MVKTIMAVDDNPDLTRTVKQGLETLDSEYTVVCVDSGKNCLRWLKENHLPDLILLDIMMPGMSGWETYEWIKKNLLWKNIPIVFLTGRTDEIAEKAGRFFGDDYIEKPFDMEDLKERIDTVLNEKQKVRR